jgi:hypothetical protein
LVTVAQGTEVEFHQLTLRTWSIRGNDGRERTGVSLRANGMDAA